MKCSEQSFKQRQMLPGNLQPHLKAIRAFQDFYWSLLGVNDVPCPCGSWQMCKALPRKATLSSQESGKSRIYLSWNKTSPAQTHCPALTPMLKGSGSAPQQCINWELFGLEGTFKPISLHSCHGQGQLPPDQAAPSPSQPGLSSKVQVEFPVFQTLPVASHLPAPHHKSLAPSSASLCSWEQGPSPLCHPDPGHPKPAGCSCWLPAALGSGIAPRG